MPRGGWACAPQLLSLSATTTEAHSSGARALRQRPLQWEACTPRLENIPCLPQLEKACVQPQKSSTARNKYCLKKEIKSLQLFSSDAIKPTLELNQIKIQHHFPPLRLKSNLYKKILIYLKWGEAYSKPHILFFCTGLAVSACWGPASNSKQLFAPHQKNLSHSTQSTTTTSIRVIG